MKTMSIVDMQNINAGGTYYCKYRKYGCGRYFTYDEKGWFKKTKKKFARWCRDSHQGWCSYKNFGQIYGY